MTTPRRLRFAFSLRTMFVVVTLFCVWLGWQVETIIARKKMVNWLNSTSQFEAVEIDHGIAEMFARMNGKGQRIDHDFSIPWYRKALGDKPVAVLIVPLDRHEEAEALFPEARVYAGRD